MIKKFLVAAVATSVAVAGLGLVSAGADTIVSDVDISVDTDTRVATIVSGGIGVVVKYQITHPDDAPNPGECDANIVHSSHEAGPVTVTPTLPTGVTASATSTSFTTQAECTDGTQKPLTFNSSTPGTYAISHEITWTSKSGNSRTMDNAADFTLEVLPRPASNLAAVPGDTEIDLSWDASSDGPTNIDGYRIYQDEVAIGVQTDLSRTITGLTNDQQYCFTVTAYKDDLESDHTDEVCETPVESGASTVIGTFLSPVDGDGTINVVKKGRVVPVKIHVTSDNEDVTDGPVTFTQRTGECDDAAVSDAVEVTAGSSNVGSSFKPVVEAGITYWQYNLPTKNLSLGCKDFDIWYDGDVVGTFILNIK